MVLARVPIGIWCGLVALPAFLWSAPAPVRPRRGTRPRPRCSRAARRLARNEQFIGECELIRSLVQSRGVPARPRADTNRKSPSIIGSGPARIKKISATHVVPNLFPRFDIAGPRELSVSSRRRYRKTTSVASAIWRRLWLARAVCGAPFRKHLGRRGYQRFLLGVNPSGEFLYCPVFFKDVDYVCCVERPIICRFLEKSSRSASLPGESDGDRLQALRTVGHSTCILPGCVCCGPGCRGCFFFTPQAPGAGARDRTASGVAGV